MNFKVSEKLSPLIQQPLQGLQSRTLKVAETATHQDSLPLLAFEQLASSLLHSAQSNPLKTIAIIGATAGVGTSMVALNLARTLTATNENVLLVTLSPQDNPEKNLLDKHPCTSAETFALVRKTGSNFYQIELSMARLLQMPSFKEILGDMEQKFSRVIWDVPPVDKAAHSRLVCQHAQGVILVVHAGKTRWHSARHTLDYLRFADVPVIGVVLNKKRAYIPKWIYRLLFRYDS